MAGLPGVPGVVRRGGQYARPGRGGFCGASALTSAVLPSASACACGCALRLRYQSGWPARQLRAAATIRFPLPGKNCSRTLCGRPADSSPA